MQSKIITILEDSGEISRHLLPKLIKAGALVKIISNTPRKILPLKTVSDPGRLTIIPAGNFKAKYLYDALQNSDAIINCHDLSLTSQKQMVKANIKLPILLGRFAKDLKINTLIHISTLNANKVYDSDYTSSKYEGEKSLTNEFHNAIIIRPSIFFGTNNDFISNTKNIIKSMPLFPIFNHGKCKMQPIYVGDVAEVIFKILQTPKHYYQKIIELGGQETISLKNMVLMVAETLQKPVRFLNLPYPLLYLLSILCSTISFPTLTRKQIQLFKYNILIKKENNLIFIDSFHIKQYTLRKFIRNKLKTL